MLARTDFGTRDDKRRRSRSGGACQHAPYGWLRTRIERPFGIDAWVVLPDHRHCVWALPEGDADFATRWSVIKARFSRAMPPVARRASQERRREHGVWQRRFWEHHIRDEQDWGNHNRYCWFNPVKHGFIEHPRDWPYSSWHRDNP
ncbi:REP-associated tyrosine transposase [Pararhodobacter aggregans]